MLTHFCPLNTYCGNLNKLTSVDTGELASKTSYCTGSRGGTGPITTDSYIAQNQLSTYRLHPGGGTEGKLHLIQTTTVQSQLSDRKVTCEDPTACPTNTTRCEENTEYSGEGLKCWGCYLMRPPDGAGAAAAASASGWMITSSSPRGQRRASTCRPSTRRHPAGGRADPPFGSRVREPESL